MHIQEELRVEAINDDDEAILVRPNYRKVEYPVRWIPFSVKVGDVLSGIVHECSKNTVSRIDFIGFAD